MCSQVMEMTLQRFFERYADLSLAGNPKAMAALYAPTFIVAGPQGSQAFGNDEKFLDWLRQVDDFNREHGMRSLEVVSVNETELSPIHMLASVRWGARFTKTGDRPVEFEIAYFVEKSDKAPEWKILAYVSQRDQEAEMKELGLL
jgi:hypothetical protein